MVFQNFQRLFALAQLVINFGALALEDLLADAGIGILFKQQYLPLLQFQRTAQPGGVVLFKARHIIDICRSPHNGEIIMVALQGIFGFGRARLVLFFLL